MLAAVLILCDLVMNRARHRCCNQVPSGAQIDLVAPERLSVNGLEAAITVIHRLPLSSH